MTQNQITVNFFRADGTLEGTYPISALDWDHVALSLADGQHADIHGPDGLIAEGIRDLEALRAHG